ncbi:MAG: hypothetical protein DME10_12150 [Candidatus Rokuibacteriota bacterium]|nr:MAG: hypothetical protein DME10_12150 [Candidatus Rokubacteria bacterium]
MILASGALRRRGLPLPHPGGEGRGRGQSWRRERSAGIAAQIFMGGANLYGLGEMDLKKADAVAAKS